MNKDLSSGYILTAHLQKYKNYMEPYDASYIPEHDIPINWWNTIEPKPDYLQELLTNNKPKITEEQVLQVLNELNEQILEEEIIDQEELLQYIDHPSSNTRSANLNNKKLNLESNYTIDNNDSSSEKSNEEILQNIQNEELNSENNNGIGNFNWDLNDLIIDNNDD
ncbi:hypothetical protein Glove_444g18 [Diversispora epigaea]|uniref:Uncharacterized protein n=1 Tax=Diversispora epigaea TaxID=1348612 RepID=A0A397GQW4_9GLOM|nr:hypothetical protein Glove_444g18 [Diversispora epigaea]